MGTLQAKRVNPIQQVRPFYFLPLHNSNSMNKLPANLQQVIHKSAQANLRRPAAAFIPQFQSQQGITEPVGTACFSHQLLSIDVSQFELRPVTFDSANEEIRVKPAPTGLDSLRDIVQKVVRLISRIKETLIDCVCAVSIRRNTTHSKRPAYPWMIHPDSRLQTDTNMINIQSMCIESPSIQRLMGNTIFVV